MASLHEQFLQAKQMVADAVSAVNSATEAAASIVEQTITEALSALHELDDALDYFGLVGDPIDAAVDLLIDQLFNLAKLLDDRGYYAIYRKFFSSTNQYQSAKSAYDGFVGGLGGTSGGGGASGSWGDPLPPAPFPWFGCFNRSGAIIHHLPPASPPSEDMMNFSVLLGPCSDVIVYEQGHPDGYWGAGLYQYVRLRILIRFVDQDVIFAYDWGESPAHPTFHLGFDYVITDRTEAQYFQASYNTDDWEGANYNRNIPTWPYDTSDRILTQTGEAERGKEWKVVGRHMQWDHEYWLYNIRYWEVWHVAGIPDGYGGFYGSGKPEQLVFVNPCSEPPIPGKDIIPIPIPIIIDDKKRQKAMDALHLGVIWLPYDLCFNGQRLLWEGEQLTFGDV